MNLKQFSRRDTLKSLAGLSAAGTLGAWNHQALAQKPLTVGIIYVDPREDRCARRAPVCC